ncbi:MAG: hypothetical protein KF884_07655 [Fimbriimonadaceae bacterium]|nr:hypothetical protein [Fimbriimonadaceae bacterium]QYK57425.1 MAG: hypothetical protein KF884_07655 [Fimbriimonadaceae bacterium]
MEDSLRKFGVGEEARHLYQNIAHATYAKIGAAEYIQDPKNFMTFQFGHWNKSPCSYAEKYYTDRRYRATLVYKLRRYTTMPDGSTLTTDGPSSNGYVNLWVPIKGSFTDDRPQIACACSIVKEGTDFGLLKDEHGNETGVACVHDGTTKLLGGAELKDIGLTFEGHSLSRFTVSVKNKPPHCERIIIPAGFEYVCADGSAQDVLQVQDMTIEFPGGSNFGYIASVDPFIDFAGWARSQTDVRTLCLNMRKPSPRPGKPFFLSMPRDPGTLRLARLTRDARFGGPWDQVRLWLYTDRASMDEMGKILIPGPSPRVYLRELHTLVKERLIDLDPKADAKIVDDRLLVAAYPDEEALEWYVSWKLQHQQAATLKFVRSAGKALAEHFKEGKPEDAAAGAMALVAALAKHGGDEGTSAALELLGDKALEPYRGALMADNRAGMLFGCLTRTSDAGLAGKLLDLAEAHPSVSAAWACLNVDPALPEAVRTRAEKLAARVLPPSGGGS